MRDIAREERLSKRQQQQLRSATTSPGKVRMGDGQVSFSKGSMDEDEDSDGDVDQALEEELKRVKGKKEATT